LYHFMVKSFEVNKTPNLDLKQKEMHRKSHFLGLVWKWHINFKENGEFLKFLPQLDMVSVHPT
jgi:hypothetical protein